MKFHSFYGGIITKIKVMPGSIVSKGQTMVFITNPQLIPLQEEYLGQAPKISLAEAELKRQQELTSGIAEIPMETKFVTKGAFFLQAKMTSDGEPHAH